jgi:hypothetical protein
MGGCKAKITTLPLMGVLLERTLDQLPWITGENDKGSTQSTRVSGFNTWHLARYLRTQFFVLSQIYQAQPYVLDQENFLIRRRGRIHGEG